MAYDVADGIMPQIMKTQIEEQRQKMGAQRQKMLQNYANAWDTMRMPVDVLGWIREVSTSAAPVAVEDLVVNPAPMPAPPSASYRERLKKIGAVALASKIDADARVEEFKALIVEKGLRFYDQNKVVNYLRQQAVKAGMSNPQVSWNGIATYRQAIPSPVIDTMCDIKERFSEAEFFISEVNNYPDPFLKVVLLGRSFIVEKWDEPAYREE